jgi:hypothetical protein
MPILLKVVKVTGERMRASGTNALSEIGDEHPAASVFTFSNGRRSPADWRCGCALVQVGSHWNDR